MLCIYDWLAGTASNADNFFSKSTEDERHVEGDWNAQTLTISRIQISSGQLAFWFWFEYDYNLPVHRQQSNH